MHHMLQRKGMHTYGNLFLHIFHPWHCASREEEVHLDEFIYIMNKLINVFPRVQYTIVTSWVIHKIQVPSSSYMHN